MLILAAYIAGCVILCETGEATGIVSGDPWPVPAADWSRGVGLWEIAPGDPERVRVVAGPEGYPHALEVDARGSGRIHMASEPFPAQPLRRYRLDALIQRLAGEQGIGFHVVWLDADMQFLSTHWAYVTPLAGKDWRRFGIDTLAPEETAFGRVVLHLPAGWGARFADMRLLALSDSPPDLAVDLIHDPAGPLRIRIENRGTIALDDLRVTLEVPAGLIPDTPVDATVPRLTYGKTWEAETVLSGQPHDPESPLVCHVEARAGGEPVTFEGRARPFVSHAVEKPVESADLWPPVKPETSVELGCYYFPVMLDWDRSNWGVRPVDYLEPLLGYYDEASPETADWHIQWAVSHGISFFVFDWYFNQGMDYLNDALEQGFLKSRFIDQMKFCIDWCNEGHCGQFKPVDFSQPSLDQFMTVLCERYLGHPSYLRVDGKPVVLIHVPLKIVNAHGGWEGCAMALDRLRDIARDHGHPGVYFVAVQNSLPHLPPYKEGGFDAVTAYAYGFCDTYQGGGTLPYEPLIPRHRECFATAQAEAHAQGLEYIPSAWVGWDDAARSKDHAVRTLGNTPAAFRPMIAALPEHVEPTHLLALFESWNEWGEGGEVEPGIQYRFGRLSAIRDAISTKRGPMEVPVPTPEVVERLNTDVTWDDVEEEYLGRYARQLGLDKGLDLTFDSVHDLWMRPSGTNTAQTGVDGTLAGVSLDNDPSLLGPPCMQLPAETVQAVEVRMKTSGGTEGKLYWKSAAGESFDEERSAAFTLRHGDGFETYTIPLSGHPAWQGVIYQFRFDPQDGPGPYAIDRFRTLFAGDAPGTQHTTKDETE